MNEKNEKKDEWKSILRGEAMADLKFGVISNTTRMLTVNIPGWRHWMCVVGALLKRQFWRISRAAIVHNFTEEMRFQNLAMINFYGKKKGFSCHFAKYAILQIIDTELRSCVILQSTGSFFEMDMFYRVYFLFARWVCTALGFVKHTYSVTKIT